jgi:hypothetical protein
MDIFEKIYNFVDNSTAGAMAVYGVITGFITMSILGMFISDTLIRYVLFILILAFLVGIGWLSVFLHYREK